MTVPMYLISFLLGLVATSFAFELGVTNEYRYETSVVINEDCSDALKVDLTGYRLDTKLHLKALWQDPKNSQKKLMKIEVLEPKLLISKKSAFQERKSDLENIATSESFFLLSDNRVEKFWDNPSEHFVFRNLKRSVASFLQVKDKDGEEQMDDVSGKCDVFYKVEVKEGLKSTRRSKIRCTHPVEHSVSSQPFGVRSPSVQRSTGIDCKEDLTGIVSQCLVTEQVKAHSNLWKNASICVYATSAFTLESKYENISENKQVYKNADYKEVVEDIKKKGGLVEGNLLAVYENKEEQVTANVADSTKSFQDSLKVSNLAKLKSASGFYKLLPIFRSATKDDFLKVLENKKFEPIMPQILDLLAASLTPSSVDAVLTFFGKTRNFDERLERYLISLSVLPRSEAFLLEKIKAFLEKGGHHEKIEATLISTLGSLLKTYAKNIKVDSKTVDDVLEYLHSSMKKCKTDECTLRFLRGLRNAAHQKSEPLLLEYAMKGGKPSLEALFAVRNMNSGPLSTQSQQLLLKIFHQVGVKQDRSARALAAEILLKKSPDSEILKSVIGRLSDQSDEEFSTFVVSKIFRLMESDKELRSKIFKILPEKQVAHYYSLSQKGKSSLFNRQLMSTDELNITYGIEMELLEGGLLKRSSFDVEFETDYEVSNLLSVGIFSEGLGSFAGESSSDDSENPLAGMELTLLGSSLRPYVFFSSTSELMGHAWSGTASEPTPALQGIFSLSDDNQLIVLHNGMTAKLQLRGVLSTDMSAAIQISLWNRNSQSQVKNAAALLVKGSMVVDVDFAKARGEYLYYGSSAINFSTDLDFAETPFKMCLQMENPDIVIKHDFQRSVEVTETKFSLKKTKKRKRFIPSRSYALHQNNNELCRIMKSSDY